MEFEIDKEKFAGRGNIGIPKMIKNSTPFSQKISLVTEGIIALKRTVKIEPKEKVELDLIISVGESKELVLENVEIEGQDGELLVTEGIDHFVQ